MSKKRKKPWPKLPKITAAEQKALDQIFEDLKLIKKRVDRLNKGLGCKLTAQDKRLLARIARKARRTVGQHRILSEMLVD